MRGGIGAVRLHRHALGDKWPISEVHRRPASRFELEVRPGPIDRADVIGCVRPWQYDGVRRIRPDARGALRQFPEPDPNRGSVRWSHEPVAAVGAPLVMVGKELVERHGRRPRPGLVRATDKERDGARQKQGRSAHPVSYRTHCASVREQRYKITDHRLEI